MRVFDDRCPSKPGRLRRDRRRARRLHRDRDRRFVVPRLPQRPASSWQVSALGGLSFRSTNHCLVRPPAAGGSPSTDAELTETWMVRPRVRGHHGPTMHRTLPARVIDPPSRETERRRAGSRRGRLSCANRLRALQAALRRIDSARVLSQSPPVAAGAGGRRCGDCQPVPRPTRRRARGARGSRSSTDVVGPWRPRARIR